MSSTRMQFVTGISAVLLGAGLLFPHAAWALSAGPFGVLSTALAQIVAFIQGTFMTAASLAIITLAGLGYAIAEPGTVFRHFTGAGIGIGVAAAAANLVTSLFGLVPGLTF